MQSNKRQRTEEKIREAASKVRRRISGAAERLGGTGQVRPARQKSGRSMR